MALWEVFPEGRIRVDVDSVSGVAVRAVAGL
jgi:hypothetical protein